MNKKNLSVQLPEKTLNELDRVVERGHYATRSDLIRDMIRRELEAKKC